MSTVTIRDVARHAAVSVASASRALNNHASVTPATRQRVLEAARELDYVPHLGARSLSRGRSNTIGVVLPDLFGEFFSEIIRGIDRAAHRRGLQLLLSNMHGSAEETELAIRAMRGRVDGLLVMSPQVDAEFLGRNLPKGLPAIVMNAAASDGTHPTIAIDNLAGAREAVAHLVAQGCTRIAHLTGPRGNADADARRAGFRAAVLDLLGPDAGVEIEGDFSEASGIDAARRILGERPRIDGVFAANDMMAVACMATLAENGVRAPDDVAIIGFDGVPIAQYVTPALSTMTLNLAELGERALDKLVAISEADAIEATTEMLKPELVVRASSRRRRDA
ncbi:MAG: LacI family DNA-binding transcriptional regulator [Sphingomonas sp.]|uniref:LacI family DNA-binding transcriptional regulator n=1 Tax=Sphingomonas sp. TaxID=28214 RepID=UPI003F7EE687